MNPTARQYLVKSASKADFVIKLIRRKYFLADKCVTNI